MIPMSDYLKQEAGDNKKGKHFVQDGRLGLSLSVQLVARWKKSEGATVPSFFGCPLSNQANK